MKKVLFALAIATVLTACGAKTEAPAEVAADTTVVEVVDSVAVDTVAVDTVF